MKKILISLLIVAFSGLLFGQEPELSDYEKYRIEQEKELYPEVDEEVFFIVEDMPTFNGEDAKEFRKWIAQNVKYPQEAIKNSTTGKVIVSFIVNEKGKVINGKIEKSVDPYLDAEAIRVVESSPKWTPGKQRGKAVKVQFTFPINFVLQEEQASEPVVINNYYNGYNQPNLRFNLTFGYIWGYYNQPHYGYYDYYDPWYYDSWYGYYPYNYPYYRNHYYGSFWYGHHHHRHNYGYNHWKYNYNNHYYSYKRPKYNRPSTIRDPKNYATRSNVGVTRTAPSRDVRTTRTATKTRYRTADKTRNGTRNRYSPTYNKPRTQNRESYNTKPRAQRRTTVSTPARTQRSTTYSRPSSTSRASSSYSRPSSQSRSYSTPSRSSSRSYSTPSRSSSRSYSTPSRSSSSYRSSGGSSRSSGSATRSSGGSRSKR